MLKMHHPDFPDAPLADCPSEEAFESVWKDKGWQLVPAEDLAAALSAEAEAAAERARLATETFTGHTEDEYSKDYLVAAADSRDLDTSGTKAEILGRLQDHEALQLT